MTRHSWQGQSGHRYDFAVYPALQAADVAGAARFYMGRPIIYAFVAYQPSTQLELSLQPLYFGHAADGFQHFRNFRPENSPEFALRCAELHVLQASPDFTAREKIVADLLAARPTMLNYYALGQADYRNNQAHASW